MGYDGESLLDHYGEVQRNIGVGMENSGHAVEDRVRSRTK